MAVTLQITDGTTTVNLANATGPELESEYLPTFAVPTGDGTIPPDVIEAVPVLVRIGTAPTTGDNVAATLQAIAALTRAAAEYSANNHQTPVWFHRKLNTESSAIRFLVKRMSFVPNARFGGLFDEGPALTDGRLGVLTITHHPYGESVTTAATAGTDNVSVIGGLIDYTNVVGDVPARMYYTHIDDLAVARVYRQFWMGFRSDNRAGGDAANVASLWECEDGTPNIDTALAPDATASPGGGGNTKLRCDFNPTVIWAERFSILMSDVTANYANQVGAFVVLLRAMVNSGVAQVYLRSGTNTDVVYQQGPVVDIADTAWNIYNLGTVEFPIRDLHAAPTALFAATYDQRDGIALWARVKPGEATPSQFDMDCLILIPADEYFIHVQSAEVAAASDRELYALSSPEDVASSLTIDGVSGHIDLVNPISIIGAGIPVGDGRLFICVANDNEGTAPGFGDTVDVEISTYPRWVYFRGAE